jgi:hypothetical protein
MMTRACALQILCAALALLPPPIAAASGGDSLPHVSAEHRHPRACRHDDARCLALQRDVCDPFNVTATDKYVLSFWKERSRQIFSHHHRQRNLH